MKLKLFVFLMAGLLLVGCSQDYEDTPETEVRSEEVSSMDKEDSNEEDGSVKDETVSMESKSEETTVNESSEYETTENSIIFTTDSVDGEEVYSMDLFHASKVTMVNVWGTFCNPCLNEMPVLGEISKEYDSSEFQLVGVVADVYQDDSTNRIAVAKTLIDSTGANYLHLLLNQEVFDAFVSSSQVVPTTYFFNEKGEIIDSVTGAYEKEDWEKIIESVLQK